MTIYVELDAFSGRPNPGWAIDDEQSRQLVTALNALPATSAPSSVDDGLGYRGFKIRGLPATNLVTAGHGMVTVTTGSRVVYRLDAHRTIEAFLLRNAQGRVDDALLQTLTALVLP